MSGQGQRHAMDALSSGGNSSRDKLNTRPV
jgi:hypothetical protein